jgi:hypothetical protein
MAKGQHPLECPLNQQGWWQSGGRITAPIPVVRQVSFQQVNGVEMTRNQYHYRYLKSKRVEGSLGFGQIVTRSHTDNTSDVITRTDYRQDAPYTGAILSNRKWLNDEEGTRISINLNSYNCQGFNTSRSTTADINCDTYGYVRNQILNTSVTQADYDAFANGNPIIAVTTTNSQFDGWGNPTSLTTTTTDSIRALEYKKITTNSYTDAVAAGDTWRLPRISRSQVQSLAPNTIPTAQARPPQDLPAEAAASLTAPPPPMPPAKLLDRMTLSAILGILLY